MEVGFETEISDEARRILGLLDSALLEGIRKCPVSGPDEFIATASNSGFALSGAWLVKFTATLPKRVRARLQI